MKVVYAARARADLEEISAYISRDSVRAARAWLERLRQRARDAALVPWAGRQVPEGERHELREVFLGTYRIVYEVLPDAIQVLAIREGHRLLPDLTEP